MSQEEAEGTLSHRETKITALATGDSMLTRRISVYAGMDPLRELLKTADVRFTNCETLFHRGESYAMPSAFGAGTRMIADPSVARDLKWMGINLASVCNNHTMNYGPVGMFSTMRALDENDIVHAGSGRDLDEAREPRYLETPSGRVALVAGTWSDHQELWERAANMKAGVKNRPGINLFRVKPTHTITKEHFDVLKRLINSLGLDPPQGMKRKRAENELTFLGHMFMMGENEGTTKTIRKEDYDDFIRSIQDARKTADWVFVSFHTHDSEGRGSEYPSLWVREFARDCIHAGADAYFGHGAHILQGLEIYEKKPIFYSLGNFIIQDEPVNKVSYDQYESFGLDRQAKPSDFFHARSGLIPPGLPPYAQWWFESVIPLFELGDEGLDWLKIYPISMGLETKSLVRHGHPQLDTSEKGKATLKRLQELSSAFNTKITVGEKLATVEL